MTTVVIEQLINPMEMILLNQTEQYTLILQISAAIFVINGPAPDRAQCGYPIASRPYRRIGEQEGILVFVVPTLVDLGHQTIAIRVLMDNMNVA